MHAAIAALRQLQPAHIVVAVPTGSPETCQEMRAEVDDVICAIAPEPFDAVGRWYQDFSQTTDEEVRELLALAAAPDKSEGAQSPVDAALIEALRAAAYPLAGSARDYDPLLERIGTPRATRRGLSRHARILP